jgi:hypothetical protein
VGSAGQRILKRGSSRSSPVVRVKLLVSFFEKPTTLVVGAGASAPYQFPVGSRFRGQICALENPSFQSLMSRTYDVSIRNVLKPGHQERAG